MTAMKTNLKLEGKAWRTYEEIEVAADTRRIYSHWISRFMKFCGTENPDDLLKIGNPEQIEDKVISWVISLKDAGRATLTMRVAYCAVLFFYSANRIKLNGKFISKRIPRRPARPHRAPSREELQAIMNAADMRGKAIVSIFASSGMRLGGLVGLRLRHIRKLTNDELNHADCNCQDRKIPIRFSGYLARVYDGESEQYFTLLSEEASKYLDAYLEFRRRAGEKLAHQSPLIREEFDVTDLKSAGNPSMVTEKMIQVYISRLEVAAGVRPRMQFDSNSEAATFRHEFKAVHGFRMFFNTSCLNARMHPSFKELLSGREVDLEESYYDDTQPQSVHSSLSEYVKAHDALCIFSTSKLERENSFLKEKVGKIELLETQREQDKREIVNLQERTVDATDLMKSMMEEMKAMREEIARLKGVRESSSIPDSSAL